MYLFYKVIGHETDDCIMPGLCRYACVERHLYIWYTYYLSGAEKDITVQLMNDGKRSSLIQAWIDNGDTSLPPEKLQVPFIMTPPVIRVAANSGQQIKK
ncbi:hypothetical protein SEENIN0B_02305 [Salmonella enterica subsp. enterica serovar Infantis str. SARB27]|uniref:Pili assembly chaperone N-terminal domain-containing protein n=1 Tax=Salmonella enterica subsp. enterica serovar Infantis str. SARB27 TaxID=596155 RepID=A0A6C8G9U8_SALIN|nr:hypothetical protein SEENIN0B_02305 [Salmonella enterica subsp. enterica serovar Infantis str. SARB27]